VCNGSVTVASYSFGRSKVINKLSAPGAAADFGERAQGGEPLGDGPSSHRGVPADDRLDRHMATLGGS
jgi:hypothetical protein